MRKYLINILLIFKGDFGTMIVGDEPTRSGEYKEPIKPDAVGRRLVLYHFANAKRVHLR